MKRKLSSPFTLFPALALAIVLALALPPTLSHASSSNWDSAKFDADCWDLACGSTPNPGTTPTLTINKAGIGGSGTVTSADGKINCGNICTYTYTTGAIVTLTATPNEGSTFAGWADGWCSGTGTCTLTINGGTALSAVFNSAISIDPPTDIPLPDKPVKRITFPIQDTNNKGELQPSQKESVTITIPDTLNFDKFVQTTIPDSAGLVQFQTGKSTISMKMTMTFSLSGAQPGISNDVTFYLPQGVNVNRVMKYGHETNLTTSNWYDFTCGTKPCGEIVKLANGRRMVILHLEDGKRGDNDLTVNGTIDDPVTFAQMEEDETGTGQPNPDMSTVSTKPNSGGIILPSGDRSYNIGQVVPYTIVPERGFHIADVKIDGKSVGPVHDYTLKVSSTAHTIEAVFEMGQVEINGSNKPLTIKQGDPVTVNVSLNNRGANQSGTMDWLFAVNTPSGWYHYHAASGQWRTGKEVSYQGPLFNLQPFDALKISDTTGLPPGKYTFYFGVSKTAGGPIDYNSFSTSDSVEVTVTEGGQKEGTPRTAAILSTIPATAPAHWGLTK